MTNQWIASSARSPVVAQVPECFKHPLHLSVYVHVRVRVCVYDAGTKCVQDKSCVNAHTAHASARDLVAKGPVCQRPNKGTLTLFLAGVRHVLTAEKTKVGCDWINLNNLWQSVSTQKQTFHSVFLLFHILSCHVVFRLQYYCTC